LNPASPGLANLALNRECGDQGEVAVDVKGCSSTRHRMRSNAALRPHRDRIAPVLRGDSCRFVTAVHLFAVILPPRFPLTTSTSPPRHTIAVRIPVLYHRETRRRGDQPAPPCGAIRTPRAAPGRQKRKHAQHFFSCLCTLTMCSPEAEPAYGLAPGVLLPLEVRCPPRYMEESK
jgi:hypothetical protein